jgi:hypothetical protein
MRHYAVPAAVPSPGHADPSFLQKRLTDSNNDDSAIASGGEGGGTDDASVSNAAYRFPPRHRSSVLRNSILAKNFCIKFPP